MLRVHARLKQGATPEQIGIPTFEQHQEWLERLSLAGVVVHYDPTTERGFWYVPRRPGVDLDVVREPLGEG